MSRKAFLSHLMVSGKYCRIGGRDNSGLLGNIQASEESRCTSDWTVVFPVICRQYFLNMPSRMDIKIKKKRLQMKYMVEAKRKKTKERMKKQEIASEFLSSHSNSQTSPRSPQFLHHCLGFPVKSSLPPHLHQQLKESWTTVMNILTSRLRSSSICIIYMHVSWREGKRPLLVKINSLLYTVTFWTLPTVSNWLNNSKCTRRWTDWCVLCDWFSATLE